MSTIGALQLLNVCMNIAMKFKDKLVSTLHKLAYYWNTRILLSSVPHNYKHKQVMNVGGPTRKDSLFLNPYMAKGQNQPS